MSVSIYDGTNDVLKQIAGREDTSFWEGTQAQWNALSSADKALWTGKYVIITDDEESVNKYNGTELINIAGKGQSITVDSALSDTSTNPVQNKVIKTALDEKDTAISNVAQKVSNNDDAYSSTKAYAVGDLVIYDNKLYRCTTACSAGSWATNQSCFTPDTLVNTVNVLNDKYLTKNVAYYFSYNNNSIGMRVANVSKPSNFDVSGYSPIAATMYSSNCSYHCHTQLELSSGELKVYTSSTASVDDGRISYTITYKKNS